MASLPPPHPQSLSERAKASPKAAREATRAEQLAGMRKNANAWAAQEAADIQSGAKKAPLTSNEKTMANNKLYSDLAPSNNIRPSPPAAAQSRMDANKPLKTALVREVEPGVSRDRTAANLRQDRKMGVDKNLSLGDRAQRKFASLGNATETGEAQAFVGIIKPNKSIDYGDPGRQGAQVTRDLYTPKKDLGRAVTNTISSDPEGAPSLLKIAQTRSLQGRSIAGPDAPKPMSLSQKLKAGAKAAGKAGTALGIAGGVMGAYDAQEQYKAGVASPNKIDLSTGKVTKRVKPPPVES